MNNIALSKFVAAAITPTSSRIYVGSAAKRGMHAGVELSGYHRLRFCPVPLTPYAALN